MDDKPDEWKAQADQARERLGQVESQLAQARTQLEDASKALAASERRRDLERAMAQAGAIDIDAVTLLAQRETPETEDPARAAAALRRQRPHLFKSPGTSGASAPAASTPDPLEALAHRARTTGDPRALAEYLRHRRDRNP